MTTNKKLLLTIFGLTAISLAIGLPPSREEKPVETIKVGNYCDYMPCKVCGAPGTPPCPEQTTSGWLCCNDALTVCGPAGDTDCPGMWLWCDDYVDDGTGPIECLDEYGQGLVAETGDDQAIVR